MKNTLIQQYTSDPIIAEFIKHPSFIPSKVPLDTLPRPFDIYVSLLDSVNLVNTKENGGVRKYVDAVLATIRIDLSKIDALNYWEQEKLLSVLTLLAHCYRWNYLPPCPEEYLKRQMDFPEKLWKPLTHVADLLAHPYCGTQWSTTLMNFQLKTHKPGTDITIDKIKYSDLSIGHSWVASEHRHQLEQWIKIFVMTDLVGTTANKACLELLKAVDEDKMDAVSRTLDLLNEGIQQIASVFNREVRGQKLNIEQWRNHIQPTFIWGIISDASGIPLEGASGLQVGCIQLIDLVLGLEMESKMGQAMMASRKYFPKHKRLLLERLEPYRNHLKAYVQEKNDHELWQKYNQCIDALESYRISHRQRGKAYIKGDGSPKAITTTGLSIQSTEDAVKHFEIDMDERIKETTDLRG